MRTLLYIILAFVAGLGKSSLAIVLGSVLLWLNADMMDDSALIANFIYTTIAADVISNAYVQYVHFSVGHRLHSKLKEHFSIDGNFYLFLPGRDDVNKIMPKLIEPIRGIVTYSARVKYNGDLETNIIAFKYGKLLCTGQYYLLLKILATHEAFIAGTKYSEGLIPSFINQSTSGVRHEPGS